MTSEKSNIAEKKLNIFEAIPLDGVTATPGRTVFEVKS